MTLDPYVDHGMTMRLDPSTWKKLIFNGSDIREIFLDGIDMSSINKSSLSLLLNLSSSLVSVSLQNTRLQGNLPPGILCLPNLQELILSENENLRGSLPKSNWTTPLRLLDLSSTSFSGEIPNSIGHLKCLNLLWLYDCKFDGLVPSSLWNLSQLMCLVLHGNYLTGEIPPIGSNLKHLTLLELSSNRLEGQIPSSLFNLTQPLQLDLSSNMFEGDLPTAIGELSCLIGLNLSHNGITGTIPQSFNNLIRLERLDLSMNQLTGEIPMALLNLNLLSFLNLSYNQLSGMIPRGRQFNTFEDVSHEGNPMLCGFPLSKSCKKDEEQLPQLAFHHEQESGFGWKAAAVGYASGVVFGMVLGYSVFFTGKPHWLARLVGAIPNTIIQV